MFSVVVASRNDDHGGRLLHRFGIFVGALAEYKRRYNWNLELVLVEWNPPTNEKYLYQSVVIPDSLPCRVFIVPPEIHHQFGNAGAVPMFLHIAHNVGTRRARGDWVLISSQDVVFSQHLARWLAVENLDRDAFYRAARFDSTVEKVHGDTLEEQIAHLAANVRNTNRCKPRRLFTKACGDFILMHRAHWQRLRGGYPEWGVFATYLDGLVLHNAQAIGLRQVVLDDTRVIYHIEHANQGIHIYKQFPHIHYTRDYHRLCRQIMSTGKPLPVNKADWGLGDCEEEQIAPNVWRLVGSQGKKRGRPLK